MQRIFEGQRLLLLHSTEKILNLKLQIYHKERYSHKETVQFSPSYSDFIVVDKTIAHTPYIVHFFSKSHLGLCLARRRSYFPRLIHT